MKIYIILLPVSGVRYVVSVVCLSVTYVLWLNGTSYRGSAMVLLDRATATLHRLSKITTFYLQRFGCNFECNIAVCSRHPPCCIPMLILAFDGVNKTVVTLGNCFLSATDAGLRT